MKINAGLTRSTRSTTRSVGKAWSAAWSAARSARAAAGSAAATTARTASRLTYRILICGKARKRTASTTGSTGSNGAGWTGSARFVIDWAVRVAAVLSRWRNIDRLRLGLTQYRLADLTRLADPLRIAHHIGIGYQRWVIDHTWLSHHLRHPDQLWHLYHTRRVDNLGYRYLTAAIHDHRLGHDLLGEDHTLFADQAWRLLHGDALREWWRYSWSTLWYCFQLSCIVTFRRTLNRKEGGTLWLYPSRVRGTQSGS